jgi:hypothetical protein
LDRGRVVTEDFAPYVVTTPSTNGDKPLPRRVGMRTMLPLSWMQRELRVSYVAADGSGQETRGTLADWCPVGPVLIISGARTIVGWDRLVLVELAGD